MLNMNWTACFRSHFLNWCRIVKSEQKWLTTRNMALKELFIHHHWICARRHLSHRHFFRFQFYAEFQPDLNPNGNLEEKKIIYKINKSAKDKGKCTDARIWRHILRCISHIVSVWAVCDQLMSRPCRWIVHSRSRSNVLFPWWLRRITSLNLTSKRTFMSAKLSKQNISTRRVGEWDHKRSTDTHHHNHSNYKRKKNTKKKEKNKE